MTRHHTTNFVNDPRELLSINNAEHWRYRAEEMRTIADGMNIGEPRAMMQRNADSYDRMAARAEQRKRRQ